MSELIKGVLESTSTEWIFSLILVFGGCCSNVWALEAVLDDFPASGTFLTFAQFLFVTIQNAPSQFADRRLKERQVPLSRWIVQVVLFLGVSLINNYVFALSVPLTLHIIFRSGGLCVSMVMGYVLAGRHITRTRAIAGLLITMGIILATLSTQKPRKDTISPRDFYSGVALLTLALLLSAWLGIYQEETYRRHGKQWREGLFYTHLLSLPFFVPLYPTLLSNYKAFSARPHALWALLINVFTQSLCIRGVNRLTARVNSTTVNLILTIRKAVSLALSVWYHGSDASFGLILGGSLVLLGTVLYTYHVETKLKVE